MPPLSSVGASTRGGEAAKLPFRSRTMAYGSTCSPTDHQYQVAAEQLVIGLMHSGHCSAPSTMDPPCGGGGLVSGGAEVSTGADVAGCDSGGWVVLLFPPPPPQATATIDPTASRAIPRMR